MKPLSERIHGYGSEAPSDLLIQHWATEVATLEDHAKTLGELNELAWGIIANASGGDWTMQTDEWQHAAANWRDKYHVAR